MIFATIKRHKHDGAREEACVLCGDIWNVSIFFEVGRLGYICPNCYSGRTA
jgi:hypothetical protein